MSHLDDIKSLKSLTNNLSEDLSSVEHLLSTGNVIETNNKLIEIETISEKIVNKARLLPSAFFSFSEEMDDILQEKIIENTNITISYILDGDGFYVKLPRLLPKKNGGNPIYIRTSLAVALENFFKSNRKIRLTKPSTIIFKHNYDESRPEKEMRDHDNIELNVVVDLIAMHVLSDDSPLLLRHYYFSSKAQKDSTEVFVVPNDKFISTLEKIQND